MSEGYGVGGLIEALVAAAEKTAREGEVLAEGDLSGLLRLLEWEGARELEGRVGLLEGQVEALKQDVARLRGMAAAPVKSEVSVGRRLG